MKKNIQFFLLCCLTFFSFFYTDKVINMINKKDPIMIRINDIKLDYNILPVNALIDNDTIIPGINGREVDVEKSYNNMKYGGVFREEALVFSEVSPSNSLSNNKDKYIIKGNGISKKVAMLYIFDYKDIDEIKTINNITLFINHKDLNISNIKELRYKEIYTYGNNGVYNKENLLSDNTLINRISNNKSTYCLVKEKNKDILNLCNENGMYVVFPSIIGGYYEIKNNISNGSIILLNSLNDMDSIIKYVEGKGYNIVTLSNLLSE